MRTRKTSMRRPMGETVGPRRAVPRGRAFALRILRALAAIVILVLPTTARPEDKPPDKPKGLERVPGPMPTTGADMLMLADALLRAGHVPETVVLLKEVTTRFPGTGWALWGQLGLGFLELSRGRFAEARPYYEAAN